ncbi:MAG: hypothetical protein EZS28_018690, partial [Streblomastix strix]
MDLEEEQKTQWIRDAGQKLIDQIQKSFEDALEIARNIKLEWSGWFSTGFLRLKCLCDDSRLDGYFYQQYLCPAYNNLQDKSKQFIVNFSKSSDDTNTKFYNEFKRQFPNIEKEIKQRGENSLFREKFLTELKIKQYTISLAQAISRFIPLFTAVDLQRARNLHIDQQITVRNSDKSIIGKDFNALIGGSGKDQLRFISSSITADFGVHIDRAQTSNCGNVTIDNLSNDDATVELKDIQENKLKIKLASNSVNVGEKIDIQFSIVEQSSEEPSISCIFFKIVAKSKKKQNQTAICEIRAFIRRTPLCALIESSSSLMLSSATSCTLAPKNFTEIVTITHHIPQASLSSRAIDWSVNSSSINVANKPSVTMNKEQHKMVIQFESDTTGLCAGQMTVGFGLSELYKLNLKVPVSRIPLIKIYHPADPKLPDISLVYSDYTHIVVQNNGDLEREIQLNSSEEDVFYPQSFLLNPKSSKLIKIMLCNAEQHIISAGRSKFTIKLIRTKPSFSQHQGIYIKEGVYFPCFKINVDGSSEFKYMKRQSFSNGQYPTIVTENDCINKILPMKAQQEYHSMKRWILDQQQGLKSIEANITVPPEACVIWAENGKNHQYFRIIDQTLDKYIKDDVDKIEEVNRITEIQTAEITKLLVEASNLFLTRSNKLNQIDHDSVIKSAQNGAKERNNEQTFSLFILALDNEVQRQHDKTIPEIITEICREVTKREDWSTSIPAVPSNWTGKDKEKKIKGMHLIWGTITLLSTLRNPLTLTQHEIKVYRERIIQGPLTTKFDRELHQQEDIDFDQESNGEEIDCVGVIDGRFTKAENVELLLEKIENLNPPEFPPLTGNQENDKPISNKDLLIQ